MSLNGALQIGRSGLTAAQAGIQVAGNNMANAATPGYNRQLVHLSAVRGENIGRSSSVGRGVSLDAITRAVDTALQARQREALAQEHARLVDQRFLNAIETLQNELTDTDLSSLLSEFFNSFSELANNPTDLAVRSVVIEQGASVASRLSRLRADYGDVRNEIDRAVASSTEKINGILEEIETVNREIVFAEGAGGGPANSLRDQRDALIAELSTYIEVTVVEQPNGSTDLHVNSTPVFLAGQSRGVEVRTETDGDQTLVTVRVADDGTKLTVESGSLGGLLRQRDETVLPAIEKLDTFTAQLIFQVNRIHSQGQGTSGYSTVTGSTALNDTTVNLNHIDADVPFDIRNGSFFIQVTHAQSGITTVHEITVDGDADSLDDLIDRINNVVGVPNVTASLGVDNQLVLAASAGYEISFGDDTSGALAALGINTFFTGENAGDIAVNAVLQADPTKLAAGKNNLAGSNDTARAIADLQNASVADLGGRSLRQYWQDAISDLAVKADAANSAAESAILVRESIDAQISAVSGVSLDEESINLLTFQRQFQAAARFISVIDETLQVLLSIA